MIRGSITVLFNHLVVILRVLVRYVVLLVAEEWLATDDAEATVSLLNRTYIRWYGGSASRSFEKVGAPSYSVVCVLIHTCA